MNYTENCPCVDCADKRRKVKARKVNLVLITLGSVLIILGLIWEKAASCF